MGIFSKSKESTEKYISPVERIEFCELTDDDAKARQLIDDYKSGKVLCVNFNDLDLMANNKMLAFLVGATEALDGHTVEIKNNVYLFCSKKDYDDDNLRDWVIKLKN